MASTTFTWPNELGKIAVVVPEFDRERTTRKKNTFRHGSRDPGSRSGLVSKDLSPAPGLEGHRRLPVMIFVCRFIAQDAGAAMDWPLPIGQGPGGFECCSIPKHNF